MNAAERAAKRAAEKYSRNTEIGFNLYRASKVFKQRNIDISHELLIEKILYSKHKSEQLSKLISKINSTYFKGPKIDDLLDLLTEYLEQENTDEKN